MLLASGHFLDGIVRDFVLAVGDWTLGRLSAPTQHSTE